MSDETPAQTNASRTFLLQKNGTRVAQVQSAAGRFGQADPAGAVVGSALTLGERRSVLEIDLVTKRRK